MGGGISRICGSRPKARVAVVGLDASGKSATVSAFVNNDRKITQLIDIQCSTLGANLVECQRFGLRWKLFDCGGCTQFREMWTSYTAAADGIVFVIDMTDVSRLEILRTTFHGVLDSAVVRNQRLPVLVILNKVSTTKYPHLQRVRRAAAALSMSDGPAGQAQRYRNIAAGSDTAVPALSIDVLEDLLDLDRYRVRHAMHIATTDALAGSGVSDAFGWLASAMEEQLQEHRRQHHNMSDRV